jgi:hypothetical protein
MRMLVAMPYDYMTNPWNNSFLFKLLVSTIYKFTRHTSSQVCSVEDGIPLKYFENFQQNWLMLIG